MSGRLQDLKYALRALRRSPGFTATAMATLTLGIGATTAVFSVVNGMLLRPLPYADPDRLFTLASNQSLPDLEDLRAQTVSFETVAGSTWQALDDTGGAEPQQVDAALVTAPIFDVLGVRPQRGRLLSPQEDRFGGERVTILSHGFWQRRFAGDASVLGSTLPLSGQSYTVVGVLPASFHFPGREPDLYVSLRVVYPLAARERGVHFLRTLWRLKPGVALGKAQAELDLASRRLAKLHPEENPGESLPLTPLRDRLVADARPSVIVLQAAVSLVLLIGCVNLASLLVARAAARRRELAIRAAIGAGRGRLLRQLLTEALLLGAAGGALGLLVARWGLDALLASAPANLPRAGEIALDGRVLAFALVLSVGTALLFGLAPALSASRSRLRQDLDLGRASARVRRGRIRRGLAVAELALALVLLVGSGLLLKGFAKLSAVEPGFDTRKLLTFHLELPEARYADIAKQTLYRQGILDALNAVPGTRTAMVSELPLSGNWLHHNALFEGRPAPPPGQEPEIQSRSVAGDYFRVMGIPLRAGRPLSAEDRADAPLTGVVNESLARLHFPGKSPIGSRIRWARMEGAPVWITIVGVVGDVKHFGLSEPEEPALYTPYAQSLQAWKRWMDVALRSSQEPGRLGAAAKRAIWSVDASIPVTKIRTMEEILGGSIARQRFLLRVLAVFAASALALAALGVYGVLWSSVRMRVPEFGIRVALGAEPRRVLAMVMTEGAHLAAAGIGVGLALALAGSRVLSGLLFQVRPTDAATYMGVSLLLAVVALAASWLPARRAACTDPIIALRND